MQPVTTMFNEKRKAGVSRMIKRPMKIDMTPMVDLGFLLITFFVITTELSKPVVMGLNMPKDGPPMPLAASNALTVLLGKDKMSYYHGRWEDALKSGDIITVRLSAGAGLRKVILEKQVQLDANTKEGRNGLMLVIKPGHNASYKDVVDVLDEMTVCMVKSYALVNLSGEEKKWLKEKELEQ